MGRSAVKMVIRLSHKIQISAPFEKVDHYTAITVLLYVLIILMKEELDWVMTFLR